MPPWYNEGGQSFQEVPWYAETGNEIGHWAHWTGEKYAPQAIQASVDNAFGNYGFRKETQSDSTVCYYGSGAAKDYGIFSRLITTLKDKDWFMSYVSKWLWYSSDDGEDENDFAVEDVLLHYAGRESAAWWPGGRQSTWRRFILTFASKIWESITLNQRQHIDVNDSPINTVTLVKTINNKTSDYSMKNQIVIEVAENKNEYQFNCDDDYNTTVEKAFDKILKNTMERQKKN